MKKITYIPIIGALFEASGAVLHKKVLREHQVNSRNLIIYIFLAIILVMLPFTFFLWDVKPEATNLQNSLIFLAIIIISVFANLFTFYSLKREDLTKLEPIRLMNPLFTLLLAFIFSFFFLSYQSERNFSILGLALIASIALVIPHIKKHHLSFNKFLIAGLIGSFLFSLESVMSKSILPYYSSFTFYFLRSLGIFLTALIFLHPKINPIKNNTKFLILIMGIVAVFYRMILYYGYIQIGIVLTTLILLLAPILIYIFAAIFLKEKVHLKHVISSMIIIICVIIGILLQN